MTPADARFVRDRVLRALHAARTPGFHFTGHFLDFRWPVVTGEGCRVAMPDGPHLRNASGEVDLLALAVFADIALGTAVRVRDRTSARLGTLQLELRFTGAPARGDVEADARLLHVSTDTKLRQRYSSATLFASGRVFAYGSATFVDLATPPDATLGPLPWQRGLDALAESADEATLSNAERDALRRCDAQLASGADAFVEQFWLGSAPRDARSGFEIETGTHTGNRVGHMQGGLLVGAAAWAGSNAAPAGMRLSNIATWFVSPGRGTLRVRSEVLHGGRSTALVRSVISTQDGQTVLEATSQHVALAAADD